MTLRLTVWQLGFPLILCQQILYKVRKGFFTAETQWTHVSPNYWWRGFAEGGRGE